MTKKEILEYLKKKEEFERKHFPLTEDEHHFLDHLTVKTAKSRLKKADKNLEMINSMSLEDREKEEKLLSLLRPYLFEKETTLEFVKTLVMKSEGLLIETPAILTIFGKVYPQIQAMENMFPKAVKITTEENEKETILNVKIILSKKLLEIKESKETIEQFFASALKKSKRKRKKRIIIKKN